MFEYKVVEQKVKTILRGQMRAADLESLVNKYARDGWILDRIFAAETKRFMRALGDKDVLMVIFKREVAAAIVALILLASPASALVLCTMPDGKKYAGDFPPAGCEVESEYKNAPPRPPTAEEVQAAVKSGVEEAIEEAIEESSAERDASFLASAVRERRQIERELSQIANRIGDLEADLANVPVVNPARYRDTTVGWQRYREDQQTTSDARTALHRQIGDLRGQAISARYKFDRLTEQVKRANGGTLPPSWRPLE